MFSGGVAQPGRCINCREAKLAKRRIIAEVAGSSPATATLISHVLTVFFFVLIDNVLN